MVHTPLASHAWEAALTLHPDRGIHTVHHGGPLPRFQDRLPAAVPTEISHLEHAVGQGPPKWCNGISMMSCRKAVSWGYYDRASSPPLHTNRFGVIPKGHNANLCSTSVDAVAEIVAKLRRGALLAKIDVEAAYRLIPVHPQDRVLQAVQWENKIYVDPMLSFGLRSAPKAFNTRADAQVDEFSTSRAWPSASITWMILLSQGHQIRRTANWCWRPWTEYAAGWVFCWPSTRGKA